DAYVANFSRRLQPSQRRNRFVDHLLQRTEPNVVTDNQVYIIQIQAPQALIHTTSYPVRGKIKVRIAITPYFGTQVIGIARNSLQRLAKDTFSLCIPIVWSDIKVIHAEFYRGMNRTDSLALIYRAEYTA